MDFQETISPTVH
jgi:hypothetical protein